MNTDELEACLRTTFAPPEFAIFFEVMAGTGWSGGNGRADAVAMNLYPSRGLVVHGFELKTSRSDWLREMANAAKAEAIFRFCDHWWLVVADASIVKDGELPGPWGLMVASGNGLRTLKKAPELSPIQLDRAFIAMLARRACGAKAEEIDAAVRLRTAEIQRHARENIETQIAYLRREAGELSARIKAFETASGIQIDGWRPVEEIGKAVKAVLSGDIKAQAGRAREALVLVDDIRDRLSRLLAAAKDA